MHHYSTASYMNIPSSHSLPSPDYTGDSDSDSDVIKELEQKRRQLDEEVARFKAQKDLEFKLFESDLKRTRHKRQVQQHPIQQDATNYYEFTKNSPSATPPGNSTLVGYERKTRSPGRTTGFKQSAPIRLMKQHNGSKVTPPTICLDKMNITSENVIHSHVSPLHTPPTPTTHSMSEAMGESHETADVNAEELIHVRRNQTQTQNSHSSAIQQEAAATNGIFTPGFLNMLEIHHRDPDRQIEGTQTEPASPIGPSMTDSITVHATSLPTVSSVPESVQMPQAKRAYTSPSSLNRTRLAPIIRNVNGRNQAGGKRKHVTFQLADRAIVEPSSSYEEGPSPDIDDNSTQTNGADLIHSSSSSDSLVRPKVQRKKTPMDPFGRRKRQPHPEETPTEEVGMSMGDLLLCSDNREDVIPSVHGSSSEPDGYFSPQPVSRSPTSSPPKNTDGFGNVDEDAYLRARRGHIAVHKQHRQHSRSPRISPEFSHQASSDEDKAIAKKTSPDGYQSPRFKPTYSPVTKPTPLQYPGTLGDDDLLGNGSVGFFELDEELNSPGSADLEPELPEDKEEIVQPAQRYSQAPRQEIQTGSSVPINIIRPSSMIMSHSWMGTFGH